MYVCISKCQVPLAVFEDECIDEVGSEYVESVVKRSSIDKLICTCMNITNLRGSLVI